MPDHKPRRFGHLAKGLRRKRRPIITRRRPVIGEETIARARTLKMLGLAIAPEIALAISALSHLAARTSPAHHTVVATVDRGR